MTEDEKMQVAVFRFSVISDFVNGTQMSRAERRRLMKQKCVRIVATRRGGNNAKRNY